MKYLFLVYSLKETQSFPKFSDESPTTYGSKVISTIPVRNESECKVECNVFILICEYELKLSVFNYRFVIFARSWKEIFNASC